MHRLEEKRPFLIENSIMPLVYYTRHFPLNYVQIKKYQDIIDWYELRYNSSVVWTIPMIDEFRELLDKKDRIMDEGPRFSGWLSNNRGIEWNVEIVSYYEKDFDWEIAAINPEIYYDRNIFLKYGDRLEPFFEKEYFSDLNTIMVETKMDEEAMKAFFYTDNPMECYSERKLNKQGQIKTPFVKLEKDTLETEEQITEYAKQKGWAAASKRSADIKWDSSLLRTFKDRLFWKVLPINGELLYKGETISENLNILWTKEMLDEFHPLLDMKHLSWSTNVDWSYQIVKYYFNLWSPYWLGLNDVLWQRAFPEFINSKAMEEIFDVLLQNVEKKLKSF